MIFPIIPLWVSWGFEYHSGLKLVRATAECKEIGKDRLLLGMAVDLIDIVNTRFEAVLFPELSLNMDGMKTEGTMVTFGFIFQSDEEVAKFKNFLFEEFFPR